MNRRKSTTVRRVVQTKNNDDDVTEKPKQSKNQSKDKKTNQEIVVMADIHQMPINDKDDNQNYIPAGKGKRVDELKGVQEKKGQNKVSLNAVLARLSPLKRQMKAALAMKSTSNGQTNTTARSNISSSNPTLSAALSSKKNQFDEIEVLEEDMDDVSPIVITPADDKKKKRKPSVRSTLAKKGEAMKPSTKIALKAKIKQKGTPKGPQKATAKTQSPIALPPAPGGFIQSSPLSSSSVLGTCFLLPVKTEPVDHDQMDLVKKALKERSKTSPEDVLPLDLTTSRRDDSPDSSCEELMDSDNESLVIQEVTESGLKQIPGNKTKGNGRKRKLEGTPGENKKKKTQAATPSIGNNSSPKKNGTEGPQHQTPKANHKGLPVVMFSGKKTARKSIRDPSTPSPIKNNADQQQQKQKQQQTPESPGTPGTPGKDEGVILNATRLEGSSTQIIVKQENNEIVIRIEADRGNRETDNEAQMDTSIMDLTMSPQSGMKIATVVDRAVRAVASKARLSVNLNLSEEEPVTDENAKVNDNVKPPVKGDKPKECPICGKVFNRGGNLVGHMRKHTGERPYVCDICQKGFTFLTNLRAHMNVHTGERPYKCQQCDKAYTQLCGLQRHMASHSDAKPFVCGTCQKAFKHLHVLRRHELVHGEYRPYRCLTCGKGFLHAWHLEKHVRVHTGERPYTCEKCEATFTQKSGLQAHMQQRHSTDQELPAKPSGDNTGTVNEEAPSVGNDDTTDSTQEEKIEESNNANQQSKDDTTKNDENGNTIISDKKDGSSKGNNTESEQNVPNNSNEDVTETETVRKSSKNPREIVIGLKNLKEVMAETIIKLEPEDD